MIIGISGKIGSGKDLVGQIMQVLSCSASDFINTDSMYGIKSVLNWLNSSEDTPWEEMMFPDHKVTRNFLSKHKTVEIRKFADKLKDIVCLLIGCTREQLEDREFKEKELGEEWDFYEAGEWNKRFILATNIPYDETSYTGITKQKMTPRLMLQLLGTECGRQIIHPNIWVNALFADYVCTMNKHSYTFEKSKTIEETDKFMFENSSYPDWIITDVRFPNEAQAIKDKGGIVIRVERPQLIERDFEHPSETALDDYKFDEVIENNGSIEELIEKVKKLNIV
tara:strand:- start:2634 stop:3476 length:843 start_codon:yes stop_codon:yes gene_type:complete